MALRFVEAVDWLSTKLGKVAAWAVLFACVSAGNAMIRYS
jgi:TRAP-type mannitol/chloroaromatic compound transport system permease small subunit